jgi:hypothetical protein
MVVRLTVPVPSTQNLLALGGGNWPIGHVVVALDLDVTVSKGDLRTTDDHTPSLAVAAH